MLKAITRGILIIKSLIGNFWSAGLRPI